MEECNDRSQMGMRFVRRMGMHGYKPARTMNIREALMWFEGRKIGGK